MGEKPVEPVGLSTYRRHRRTDAFVVVVWAEELDPRRLSPHTHRTPGGTHGTHAQLRSVRWQAHDRTAPLDTGRKRNNAGGPQHQVRAVSQPPTRRSTPQQQRRALAQGASSSLASDLPLSPPGPLEAAESGTPASAAWSSPAAASDYSPVHVSDSEAMTAERVKWLSEESPLPRSAAPSPLALVVESEETTVTREEQQEAEQAEEAVDDRHAVDPALFDTAMDQTPSSLAKEAAAAKAMETEELATKREMQRREQWMESLKLQIAEAEQALTMERHSPLAKLPNAVRCRWALVPGDIGGGGHAWSGLG